jgi:hypothetical protein
MHLKYLDPEITRKLLEGHKDVISQAAEDRDKFYSTTSCPRCGGSCKKMGNYSTMYTADEPLPRFCLKCLACGEEFDPHSGLVLKPGNVGKAVVPSIPILSGPDD